MKNTFLFVIFIFWINFKYAVLKIKIASKSNVPNIANQAYQQQWRSKDSKREDSKGKKIKNFVKDNIKNISYIRDSRMQKSQYNFQKSLSRVDANLNTAHAAAPKEVNPKISEYKNFIRRQKNVKTNSTSQSVEGNKSWADNRRSVVLNKDVSNCDYIVKSQHEQVELKSSLKCMILQMQKRQKPHKNKENMSFVVVSNTAHGNPRFKSSRPSFGGWGNR